MDDAILAFLVCVLPLGMVGGLVVWLVRSGRQNASRQIAALDGELHRLRTQNQELAQRVQHLEVGLTRVYETELPALRAQVQRLASMPRSAAGESISGTEMAVGVVPLPAPFVSTAAQLPDDVTSTVSSVSSTELERLSALNEGSASDVVMASGTEGVATFTSVPVSTSAAVFDPASGSASMSSASVASVAPESGASVVGAAVVGAPVASAPSVVASAGSAASASASVPSTGSSGPTYPPSSGPTSPPPSSGPSAPSSGGWEQWVGVRGAAALGAMVLVLAGLYFFQYSIEHGLISPALRLVLGVAVGLGCVGVSDLRLRHRHPTLAQWLTGAGIAILYVAFWAGRALYDLYPSWAASIAMIATTGACVALASARQSVVVAALGLFGGFITPLALSTGQDRPITLFGYLLVLDGAMLWLAYRRRWAWLAMASLVGTALYQAGWILARLDEPRMLIGAGVLGVFALVFAALPRASSTSSDAKEVEKEDPLWRATRAGGVLISLLLALHVSHRGDLGAHFAITFPLLLALAAASAWIGARHGDSTLPLIAAIACVGSFFALRIDDATQVWQLVALLLGVALVFHAATELSRSKATHGAAIALVLGGLGVVLLRGSVAYPGGPWPWVVAIALLAALGLRQGRFWPVHGVFLSVLVGLDAALVVLPRLGRATHDTDSPRMIVLLGLALVLATIPSAVSFFRRADELHRRFADVGALLSISIVPLLLPFVPGLEALPESAFFGGVLLACVIATLAAWRLRSGAALFGIVIVHVWATGFFVLREPLPLTVWTWLGTLLPALLGIAWALVRVPSPTSSNDDPHFADDRWRWRAAALAGPLAFPAARSVHLDVVGQDTVGLVAILLASVSALVLYLAYRLGPRDPDARRSALAWASAATASLVTVAIPVQLENEWITIGWSLEALALALVWRRLDHAGLKYFALGLVVLVGVRLVGNPYVLDYYPRGAWRVINWLSYTYLVPSLALLGTWKVLHEDERPRLRAWENSVFGERAFVATFSAATAIAVVFVWINLTIFDVFAEGTSLTVPLDRLPARDLSLSVAWGLFALALLGLGMRRRVPALRITSLVLVLVTSGKVFLYDLAYLRDLYRVASLVGLALSLIAISFVYQRFVFRENARTEAES